MTRNGLLCALKLHKWLLGFKWNMRHTKDEVLGIMFTSGQRVSIGDKTMIDALLDEEGFLLNSNDWTADIMMILAQQEGLALTEAHLELIYLVRAFYEEYDLSPAMRPLVKTIKQRLGPEKGTSLYLMQLFPGSPAKRLAKLAGLPKPANCL